jgi:spore maturation protein CgeB
LITDAWEGIETFLEPDREVLVARDSEDVIRHLRTLGQSRARQIGTSALGRVLSEHTYQHRAEQLQQLLDGRLMVERVEDAA